MSFVTAGGVSLHVQELGAGPPVVMIHGLLIGSLASWYFTAAPTLARRHRVRLYDLRGHGRSAHASTGYDVATLAADLVAITADLDGPIDVVGHSWGGLIALRFAIDHPARVRRLAIVEAPLPPSRASQLAGFLDGAVTPEAIGLALPAPLRAAIAGGRRQATRLLRALSTLVFESTLLADLRAQPDFTDAELAAIRAPLLAVYGDRSACRVAGDRLASFGATLQVLPGGHYLHLDATAALTAALDAHLAEPAHG